MGFKLNRIGEKHTTNEGYIVEIIEYFGAKDCTIIFEDGSVIKNKQYSSIVNGKISNPLHKSLCSKGYLGIGKYCAKTHYKIHKSWSSMIKRCYNEKYHKKQPTYIGCSVCEEWHNFQVFAEWFEENYTENCALDKDILVKGNKVYSPDTCCFVPAVINNLLIKRDSSRGKYPIGVIKIGNRFRAIVNINSKHFHLGYFDTVEEAFQSYKNKKEKYIKEIADKYRNQITEQTYLALLNYKVEIDD